MKQHKVGKLLAIRGEDWRTHKPRLFIALCGDPCKASIEEGASGEPVVVYDQGAPYELRQQVSLNLKQLKALFILWR